MHVTCSISTCDCPHWRAGSSFGTKTLRFVRCGACDLLLVFRCLTNCNNGNDTDDDSDMDNYNKYKYILIYFYEHLYIKDFVLHPTVQVFYYIYTRYFVFIPNEVLSIANQARTEHKCFDSLKSGLGLVRKLLRVFVGIAVYKRTGTSWLAKSKLKRSTSQL